MVMRISRIVITSAVIVAMSTPASAGDLLAAAAKAAAEVSASTVSGESVQEQNQNRAMPKGYLYLGSGLFVAGLTTALVGFINNSNGDFPEFGEAKSTNVKMGTAGLAIAFGGGAILALGKRKANQSTSINFGPRTVSVSRHWSW